MTSHSSAQRAYSATSATTRTPRGLEYDTISRITNRLKVAAQKGKPGFADLAQAIHENRKLWILIATMVADENNALPQELRARLFYLAEFTNLHSEQVLEGKARVRPLLEVNTAILRGLKGGGHTS